MADKRNNFFKIPTSQNYLWNSRDGVVFGLEGLIDVKGIVVAQPMTYVRMLSDISSKTGKKFIFGVFRLFLRLSMPHCITTYRLNQVNALHITVKFSQIFFENLEKFSIHIGVSHFRPFFRKKIASSLWKSIKRFLGIKDGTKI